MSFKSMTRTAASLANDNREPDLDRTKSITQFYAQLIAENCTDAIAILDSEAKTEWVNSVFEETTGFTLEDCIGRIPGDYLSGPETDRKTLRELRQVASGRESVRKEILQYKKHGGSYWAEVSLTPIVGPDDSLTHLLVVARDISNRRALEVEREEARAKELIRQNERKILSKTTEWLYAARSLEDLYNVVETCAPKLMPESSGGLYIYSNSRDVLDLAISWGDLPSPDYLEPDNCWALRRGRAYHYGTEDIEFPCGHFHEADKSSFCLPLLAHGETIGMLWCHSDQEGTAAETAHARFWDVALMLAEQVSLTIANVRLRQELQDRSIKDPLTGLWNRRYFLDTLRREKLRSDSSENGFSLISVDVDHFKRFNDHHGHDAGDLVLRRVASEMNTAAGAAGIVCRVGGEELAVICPELCDKDAVTLAEKLCNTVKRIEIVYQGEVLPSVTMSAGVSSYPSDHSCIEDLMRHADNALYQAKRAGRDRVVLYKNDDDQRWVLAKQNPVSTYAK